MPAMSRNRVIRGAVRRDLDRFTNALSTLDGGRQAVGRAGVDGPSLLSLACPRYEPPSAIRTLANACPYPPTTGSPGLCGDVGPRHSEPDNMCSTKCAGPQTRPCKYSAGVSASAERPRPRSHSVADRRCDTPLRD